jgi:hypothetical protein
VAVLVVGLVGFLLTMVVQAVRFKLILVRELVWVLQVKEIILAHTLAHQTTVQVVEEVLALLVEMVLQLLEEQVVLA